MRTAAALLAGLSCALAGIRAGSALSERTRLLEEILTMLVEMRTRMEFGRACLAELLRLLSRSSSLSGLTFLGECAALCEEGASFPQAWQHSIGEFSYRCPLSRDDIRLLCSLGEFAGITDISGQLEFLRLSERLVTERIKLAGEAQRKYGRVCSAVGFSAGVAAGLIII